MRTIILSVLIIFTFQLIAQQKSIKPSQFNSINYLGKSGQLRDIEPITGTNVYQEKPEFDQFTDASKPVKATDPVVQTSMGKGDSIPILQTFEGVGSYNMPNPDTEGDVGPNHYFQMVKSSCAIWDKQGNLLYGPAENKTIWSDFPGIWHDYNWTDPIVVYDHLNDRWLASAMVYDLYNEYFEMIAISATPDPLGEWHCYALWFDVMPDYPKYGVWPDGYYLTINEWELTPSTTTFAGASIFVFNPEELMTGAADPTIIYFHFDAANASSTSDIGSLLPSDLDGPPPPAGTPNYHICVRDDAWGWPEDRIWIWESVIDWNDTSNCHFSEVAVLETEVFDSHFYQHDYIHQPNTTSKLHSLCHFTMYCLKFRNFGEYNSLVFNHTVEVDGDEHAGVRWYELRDNGNGWNIHQQSSFAPDEHSRWMGSIAMDADGNIGLGYTVSSDEVYPSIRVTGRRDKDELGTMTLPESEIVAGNGTQASNQRWGDYSMMTVDPVDDLTFWYTQEYLPTSGIFAWQTKIASFQLHKNLTPSHDSLVYDTYDQCLQGQTYTLKNESQYDVEVLSIEEEAYVGWGSIWRVDPFNFTLPFTLPPGDSIVLQVYFDFVVQEPLENYIIDTLNIETDYKNYELILKLNEDLITNSQKTEDRRQEIIRVYPNPFSSSTIIEFELEQDALVDLFITDNNQRLVKELKANEKLGKGIYQLEWYGKETNGAEVPGGVYYLQLKMAGQNISKVVIRN